MTMTTLFPSSTHERVGKLLPLLGSDKAGEVVAAARAIERTLRADGKDWHTLVASIRIAPGRAQPTGGHWSGLHWRSAAEFCQAHAQHFERMGSRLRRQPAEAPLPAHAEARSRPGERQTEDPRHD